MASKRERSPKGSGLKSKHIHGLAPNLLECWNQWVDHQFGRGGDCIVLGAAFRMFARLDPNGRQEILNEFRAWERKGFPCEEVGMARDSEGRLCMKSDRP